MNNSICNATCYLNGAIDILRLVMIGYRTDCPPYHAPEAQLRKNFRTARLSFHRALGGRPDLRQTYAWLPSDNVYATGKALIRAIYKLAIASDKIAFNQKLSAQERFDLETYVRPQARLQYARAMKRFCLVLQEPAGDSEDIEFWKQWDASGHTEAQWVPYTDVVTAPR